MRYSILAVLLAVLMISCKKEKMDEDVALIIPPDSSVTYKLVLTLNWRSPQFTVPANAHVTTLTGMLHAKDTFLWQQGIAATKGLEYVAEDGYNGFMNTELDSIIAHGKALSKFNWSAPEVTGQFDSTITFTTAFSHFSFASMIAPSPDWYMGINSLNLLKENKWISDITVPILLYDAGTEEGDIFGYANAPSYPQQPVSLLTPTSASVLANGNTIINSIGTIRFVKIN